MPATAGGGRSDPRCRRLHSSNETATGSAGSISKSCGPFGAVAPPHSAAISISAPAAGIAPSPTTPAETGTARSVRPAPATVGSKHVAGNFSRRATSMLSSRFLGELAPLALQNKKVVYDLLFRSSAETLLEVARDPSHLGAEIGFFSVLHTWNQKLGLHPHVHCVVPAGGLSPDHTRWIKTRYAFFLPVKVLSRVFRGKFVAALKRAFRDGQLGFHGELTLLAQPKTFSSWLRQLFRNDWVVYSKRPFGGPEHVLHYLGRYTHRVAISNHRLVSLADEKVTFRWRDSAHNNEQKLLTLSLDEFLRRFLLHLLPKGFVRIRHFGFLAHRRRAVFLPLCFHLLGSAPQEPQIQQEPSAADGSHALWFCPQCGGPMIILERLTAVQIQLRSPPLMITAVA